MTIDDMTPFERGALVSAVGRLMLEKRLSAGYALDSLSRVNIPQYMRDLGVTPERTYRMPDDLYQLFLSCCDYERADRVDLRSRAA